MMQVLRCSLPPFARISVPYHFLPYHCSQNIADKAPGTQTGTDTVRLVKAGLMPLAHALGHGWHALVAVPGGSEGLQFRAGSVQCSLQ